MRKSNRSLLAGVIGGLIDLAIMALIIVKAVMADSSMEMGVWVTAFFAFTVLLRVEHVLRRLHNPVYSVYIQTDDTENITQKVKDALAKSPYNN